MVTSASGLASENQLLYEQLLDAPHTLFGGVHPGCRAIHAKGIVCQGTFSPVRRVRHRVPASQRLNRRSRGSFGQRPTDDRPG